MAAPATIAIKDNNGITGIYCMSDGRFTHAGVYLQLFYKDEDKIRELISLGAIQELGNHVTPPAEAVSEEVNGGDGRRFFDLDKYTHHHIDSFSEQMSRLGYADVKDYACPYRVNNEMQWLNSNHDIFYNYLYDTGDEKWYLCYLYNSQERRIPLQELIYSQGMMMQVFREAGLRKTEIVNESNQAYTYIRNKIQDIKSSPIDVYNVMLKAHGIHEFEIDYAKDKQGNKIYAIYQAKQLGQKRRKCLAKHKYVQVLMKMIYSRQV